MNDAQRAIDQAKRLLDDAALFHLTSIPLPVETVSALIASAEVGLANPPSYKTPK